MITSETLHHYTIIITYYKIFLNNLKQQKKPFIKAKFDIGNYSTPKDSWC